MRSRLLIIVALLFAVCPHASRVAAQKVERAARADNFDRAEDEEDLNRELWEYVKGTPYEGALKYVAQAQARASREEVAELPNGWRIAPAGRQVEVGRLPYEAVPFNGRLVVLNAGYYTREAQEISVVDAASGQVVKTLRPKPSPGIPGSLFPSAAVGADGDLYVSGGFDEKVFRINRQFEIAREYKVAGFAAGLTAVDEHHIAVLYLAAKDEKGTYVAGRIALLNTDDGKIERESDAGYFPYSVRFVNGKLYVAVLGENRLRVFDARLGPVKELEVGRRPQEMCVDGSRLYVVNTDSDELSVVDTTRDAVVATARVSRPGSRFGATPTSCAVAGGRVYVSLAGLNAVAVLERDTWRQLGLVPVGWYPTKVLAGGNELLVLSAKGIRARRPNPNGPQPITGGGGPDYVLTLLKGSLSIISAGEVESKRDAWAKQVAAGTPTFDARRGFKLPIRYVFYIIKENRTFDQVLGDLGRGDDDPSLVLFGRDVTPNQHALAEQFVTLDHFYADGEISVLGHSFTTSGYASPFLEWVGNAAYSGRYKGYPFGMVPSVTSPTYLWDALDDARVSYRVYGENYYLYTRAYRIITETFGAESELARKFYAQTMRLSSDVDRGRIFYDFAHTYAGRADTPAEALRLLSDARFTGALSNFLVGDDGLARALGADAGLRGRFAEYLSRYAFDYRSWDLNYSDLDRFAAWRADFERQLRAGRLGRLNYLWLPNDHTNGSDTKIRTPQQFVAQNDAALGLIVETISHSSIWNQSLIIVEEDDAQNGPDHVDATRTLAFVVGPHVSRGSIVRDRFDQLSALRTVELLLGLDPLNLSDRVAVPMFAVFDPHPDAAPYTPTAPSATLSDADRARYQTLTRHAP
ncbi:MAG TPA: bifunctional YncE family protein/alkaline phosphatase family protein [Pyrinomonadaceae bacterium]|jgi:YVTN family beta-propeller protein|nr:bifunctional YncE family protein/alkaline phosphatase family protein [Pyrinomonadaceae bacterium]